MPTPILTKRRVRCALSLNSPFIVTPLTDFYSQQNIETVQGNSTRFEIGAFTLAGEVYDLAAASSVNLRIKPSQTDDTVLADQTLAAGALDLTMDAASWADGSKAHATFIFTNAEMNLPVTDTRAVLWLVVTAILTDGSEFTLGAGSLILHKDNNLPGDPPPEYPGPAITLEQAEALVAGKMDAVSADISPATVGGNYVVDATWFGKRALGLSTAGLTLPAYSGAVGKWFSFSAASSQTITLPASVKHRGVDTTCGQVSDGHGRCVMEATPTGWVIALGTSMADISALTNTNTPADLDAFPVSQVAAGGPFTSRMRLSTLWSYISAKIMALATITGAKTFTGQVELTGQAATNGTSAMNRTLGDARYVQAAARGLPVTTISTTTTTLTAASPWNYIRFTHASGCAITLPNDSTVTWPTDAELTFRRAVGAGVLTLTLGGGVTVENSAALADVLAGQSVALKKTGANTWDLI